MGGETSVQYQNIETKEQTIRWLHSECPGRSVNFRRTFSNKKRIATMVLDRRGILLTDSMNMRRDETSALYYDTFRRLRRTIQEKGNTGIVYCTSPRHRSPSHCSRDTGSPPKVQMGAVQTSAIQFGFNERDFHFFTFIKR